jgi:hypothetical protein
MDRVHGFGSWVHGIVDHSRPLILWSATRILLKRKGISNLILALHLRADASHQIRPMRVAQRSGTATPWRGSPELHSQALRGTATRGFWGKMTRGLTGSLPRWNVVGNGSKVAHGGGFPPLNLDNGERRLPRSFGFKKQLNAFLMTSSCFSRRWIGSSDGGAVAHGDG